MSENLNPNDDQPVYVDGFWFVVKWVFLFLVSVLLMTQLAALMEFKRKELLELRGLLFLLVSSFLTCIVLNVITHLLMRSKRDDDVATFLNEDEVTDES